MSDHVIQSRDLIAELQRYPLDCEVTARSGGGTLVLGDVKLHGDDSHRRRVCIDIDDGEMMKDLEGENERLDKLNGEATAMLEQFDKIMSGEVADNPHDYNNALDALHEKVTKHLKER